MSQQPRRRKLISVSLKHRPQGIHDLFHYLDPEVDLYNRQLS